MAAEARKRRESGEQGEKTVTKPKLPTPKVKGRKGKTDRSIIA